MHTDVTMTCVYFNLEFDISMVDVDI